MRPQPPFFTFTYLASNAQRYPLCKLGKQGKAVPLCNCIKSLVGEISPIPFERYLRYRLRQLSGAYSVTVFKYNSGSPFKTKSAYATGSL